MRRPSSASACGLTAGLLAFVNVSLPVRDRPAGDTRPASAGMAPVTSVKMERAVPLRELVGSYVLIQHKSDALPAVVHTDSTYTEQIIAGSIDIQRNAQFKLRYTTRTIMRRTGEVEDAPVELTGRVASTRTGLQLTVIADNGEPSEEPWSLNATFVRRALVVNFDDGDVEALRFRKR